MTRRRRAALLIGLALLLGYLAAASVAHREAAVQAQLGPLTDVVVARHALPAGAALQLGDLGVRLVPTRYAPPGEPAFAAALAGHRLAVPVAAGGTVTPELLVQRAAAPDDAVSPGERAVDIVAGGSPQAVVAGAHVDVLVTTEHSDETPGTTRLALEDVPVLAARAAPDGGNKAVAGPQVLATLRVRVADAVYLTAAQTFAHDIRLLVRAPGDTGHVGNLGVDDGL